MRHPRLLIGLAHYWSRPLRRDYQESWPLIGEFSLERLVNHYHVAGGVRPICYSGSDTRILNGGSIDVLYRVIRQGPYDIEEYLNLSGSLFGFRIITPTN